MQVVLDTNIILKSPRMDNDLFKALYRYLETTGSSLKLSTIVKKEIEAGYKKRLKKQNREYLLSSKYLNGLTMSEVPIIQLDYDTETKLFMDNVNKIYSRFSSNYLIDYTNEMCAESVRRALEKIKPCSEEKEEIRDTIIWLSTLELAKTNGDKKVIFISENIKEFAQDNKLHPTLIQDAKDNGVEILYYTSLSDFIQTYAKNINELNDEAIDNIEETAGIREELEKFINIQFSPIFARHMSRRCSDYIDDVDINIDNIDLNRDYYYVIDGDDETCSIIASYSGEVDSSAIVYKQDYDYDGEITIERKKFTNHNTVNFEVVYRLTENFEYYNHDILNSDYN